MEAWVCMCVSLLSQPASPCDVTGQGVDTGPGCHCHVSHTLSCFLSFLSPCPLQYSTSLSLFSFITRLFSLHILESLPRKKGGNKICLHSPLYHQQIFFHSIYKCYMTEVSVWCDLTWTSLCVLCCECLSRSSVVHKSRWKEALNFVCHGKSVWFIHS